jgi:hypothetical protein
LASIATAYSVPTSRSISDWFSSRHYLTTSSCLTFIRPDHSWFWF